VIIGKRLLVPATFLLGAVSLSNVFAVDRAPLRPPNDGLSGGRGGAVVIMKCGPGEQGSGVGATQTGNCSCTETGAGSASCSCSTNSGSVAGATGGAGLIVTDIFASAALPDALLSDIANAASCADAVLLLQSGSSTEVGGAVCQFSYPYYSCTL